MASQAPTLAPTTPNPPDLPNMPQVGPIATDYLRALLAVVQEGARQQAAACRGPGADRHHALGFRRPGRGDAECLAAAGHSSGRLRRFAGAARAGPAMSAAIYHRKLERVLDRIGGLYTLNDILTAIAEGKMQTFVEDNSWAITQVQDFPRARQLQLVAAVGDLKDVDAPHASFWPTPTRSMPDCFRPMAGWAGCARAARPPRLAAEGEEPLSIRGICEMGGGSDQTSDDAKPADDPAAPVGQHRRAAKLRLRAERRQPAAAAIPGADGGRRRAANAAGLEHRRQRRRTPGPISTAPPRRASRGDGAVAAAGDARAALLDQSLALHEPLHPERDQPDAADHAATTSGCSRTRTRTRRPRRTPSAARARRSSRG